MKNQPKVWNIWKYIEYACTEGGAHLPIVHALRLLSVQKWRFDKIDFEKKYLLTNFRRGMTYIAWILSANSNNCWELSYQDTQLFPRLKLTPKMVENIFNYLHLIAYLQRNPQQNCWLIFHNLYSTFKKSFFKFKLINNKPTLFYVGPRKVQWIINFLKLRRCQNNITKYSNFGSPCIHKRKEGE